MNGRVEWSACAETAKTYALPLPIWSLTRNGSPRSVWMRISPGCPSVSKRNSRPMSTRSSPSAGSVAVTGLVCDTGPSFIRLSLSGSTIDWMAMPGNFAPFHTVTSVWAPGKMTSRPPASA